ncbi:MAG: hypothetical protein HYW48_10525 [Deltaproteobacteria bacterium]|nr:hypothetical protein [Deltaproteobacteria bacterium]
MEETAQLVPPRNPGEATHHSPPQTPLSLFDIANNNNKCNNLRNNQSV